MTMKRLAWLAGLLGLAVGIVLVVHQGWPAIYAAIDHAGWALLWLLPFHVLPLLLDVFGWRVLLSPRDPERRATAPVLLWIAAIREAVNRLLPVASIGGEVVGIRLVMWRGIGGAAAAASVVMEVVLTVIAQYLFIALGFVLLIVQTVHGDVLVPALVSLALGVPVPIALFVLLRRGRVFSRLELFAGKLLGGRSRRFAERIGGLRLDREIRTLYARPVRLLGACVWQLLGLVTGSFEVWLILRLLGHPVGAADAIVVEAVIQAVRHVFFVVPAGLGVQEGGLILLGTVLGLPPDVSIALSLIRRAREIAFGVPALIVWQWIEAHRLRTLWQRGARDSLPKTDDVRL
ncbi:MAG: lysylphosphatidylglycerol synthase domain-containing protein [Rhodanobacteraceae bacterium]